VSKTYEARVQGCVKGETIEQLRKGIWLSDGRARVEGATIRRRKPTVTDLTITLHEGKNREIRRVMAKVGHAVLELKRTAIGTLMLAELKPGKFRRLSAEEIASLKALAGKAEAHDAKGGPGRPVRRGRRGSRSRSRPR
jgi:23S rRNA pseudouridine2605 synthase